MTDHAAENELLRERIAVLERALGTQFRAPRAWRLTPAETVLLGVLAARKVATREAICTAREHASMRDAVSPKFIDVMLVTLRRKLRKHGYTIHCDRGFGWFLSDEDRERLRQQCAVEAPTGGAP